MGHWGHELTTQWPLHNWPDDQVMSRLQIQIKTHPFTCASYKSLEVLHLELRPDINDYMFILVIIDEFSRWVELYPIKTTTAVQSASCIFQHFSRFGTPEVIHTDRGTAFHNELVQEPLRRIQARRRYSATSMLSYSTSTGVTPAQLISSNSISLSK